MTTANKILFIEARRPGITRKRILGTAVLEPRGWRFHPYSSTRKASAKWYGKWEDTPPRWTGGLDGTESLRMLEGETPHDTLARFPDVPEFEIGE